MAIGAIWSPPIDQQTYDEVKERFWQAGVDAGLRFHAAGESSAGWRVIEVWESLEGLGAFVRDSLDPAVQEISGGLAPRMERPEVFEVHFQGP
jgi:hypothetical protein